MYGNKDLTELVCDGTNFPYFDAKNTAIRFVALSDFPMRLGLATNATLTARLADMMRCNEKLHYFVQEEDSAEKEFGEQRRQLLDRVFGLQAERQLLEEARGCGRYAVDARIAENEAEVNRCNQNLNVLNNKSFQRHRQLKARYRELNHLVSRVVDVLWPAFEEGQLLEDRYQFRFRGLTTKPEAEIPDDRIKPIWEVKQKAMDTVPYEAWQKRVAQDFEAGDERSISVPKSVFMDAASFPP